MKGVCGLLLMALLAAMLSRADADGVGAVSMGDLDRYEQKCKHNSKDHDPGFFPVGSLEDCHIYFDCMGSVLPLLTCPDGGHFNRRLKKCDTVENAGCVVNTK